MKNTLQKPNNVTKPAKPAIGHRLGFWWTVGILLFVISIFVPAYKLHQSGEDWLSAFGLPLDRGFFRLIGDAAIPIFTITLILQQVRKLTPSREKTALNWLGWSLFAFLLVWWSLLGNMVFGP